VGKKRKRNERTSAGDDLEPFASPEADGEGGAPMGVAEVVSTSLRVYRQCFGVIFVIGFLAFLPMEVLAVAFASKETDPFKAYLEDQMITMIPYYIIATVGFVATIRASANALRGEATDLRTVWRATSKRYFSSVATSIAWDLVLNILLFLLVVPALAGAVYTAFSLQVVGLRQESGFYALRHSKALVEGHFWRVAGYVLVLFGGSELMSFGVHMLVDRIPSPWIGVPIATFADVLAQLATVAFTVLYLDLERTRFE
jgi:hypothetical protein